MPAVVSDSTPLIYLSRLGFLPWLKEFFGQVLVPSAVWAEVGMDGAGLPEGKAVQAARDEGWMVVATPTLAATEFDLNPDDLGDGELEAILLAKERDAILIIDERLGRVEARRLDLQITGTVGLILRAKRQGLIESAKPVLDRLLAETTFYMSNELYAGALEEAGESGS